MFGNATVDMGGTSSLMAKIVLVVEKTDGHAIGELILNMGRSGTPASTFSTLVPNAASAVTKAFGLGHKVN